MICPQTLRQRAVCAGITNGLVVWITLDILVWEEETPHWVSLRGSASVVFRGSVVMRMYARHTTYVLWVVNKLDQATSPITFTHE